MGENQDSKPNKQATSSPITHKSQNLVSKEHSQHTAYGCSQSTTGYVSSDNPTECESELQTIDLENQESQPLLLLFPELKQEGLNVKRLNSQISTTELTKLLVGKKAQFALLRHSEKLRGKPISLLPIDELSETSSYSVVVTERTHKERSRLNSSDADVSDNEDN